MTVSGADAQIAEAILWYASQMVTDPAIPIVWPNMPYTPQTGVPYATATFRPNIANALGISFDTTTDRQGLLQISVFWPPNVGLILPMQMASQIAGYWQRGTRIDRNGLTIKIEQTPRVAPSLQESDWVQIPVIIAWRCLSSAD